MLPPQTWRDLLAKIIQEPGEHERLARAVGVSAQMVMRWIRQEEIPSSHQLYVLLDEVPQHRALLRTLLLEEFDDFSDGISANFSVYVLNLYNTASDETRLWSICTAVLSEALQQLDAERSGLSMSVVQCMAPLRGDNIHCLRECVGLGTFPGEEQIELRTRFLGAESLAGHAVSSGQPRIIVDIDQEQRFAANLPEHAGSAAAIPILYTNRIAGCLLVVSSQRNYFRSLTRVNLIKDYAALLMLAFSPEEFYAAERIALQSMPSFQVQQPYLSTLRQRIQATWRTAFSAQRPMSYLEAQRFVWWQIAEELLQLQAPPST